MTVHAASGAVLSGTTGAFASVMTNILNKGKVRRADFMEYIVSNGGSESEALQIWLYLKEEGYVKNKEFTKKCQ